MAFLGGSLCAAFVVALAATWALCEAASLEDAYALEQSPTDAPFFYGSFLSASWIAEHIRTQMDKEILQCCEHWCACRRMGISRDMWRFPGRWSFKADTAGAGGRRIKFYV